MTITELSDLNHLTCFSASLHLKRYLISFYYGDICENSMSHFKFPQVICSALSYICRTGCCIQQVLNKGLLKEKTISAHITKSAGPKHKLAVCIGILPHTCNSSSREILSSLSKSYSRKATGRKKQEFSGNSIMFCPFSKKQVYKGHQAEN